MDLMYNVFEIHEKILSNKNVFQRITSTHWCENGILSKPQRAWISLPDTIHTPQPEQACYSISQSTPLS